MIKIPTNSNYAEIQDRFPCKGEAYPCVICGRPCPNPKFLLWCHKGGGYAVTSEEGEKLNAEGKEGGDLGNQPIGSDCLKKHPELIPYVCEV